MMDLGTFHCLNVGTAAASILPLTTDRRVFLAGGVPVRWKGVSAFPLCDRFAHGENIDPFLDAFAGYNLLRVWDYVTWPDTGWESRSSWTWLSFLDYVGARGFYVELTLLTGDDFTRIEPAKALVRELAEAKPANLVIEIGNEPRTHKHIDVAALRSTCEASGFLFASGLNALDEPFFGSFLTHHSPRDHDWQRKGGHDLYEFWTGAGPEGPHDPWHVPAFCDEPQKPHDALAMRGGDLTRTAQDYKAYFASCVLLGGGATAHYEGGKFGTLPNESEAACIAAALEGLDAFPAGTANNEPGYRRIDEQGKSSRTYTCGNCMVRIPPLTTTDAPESGWTPLGTDGILWRRA